MDRQASNDGTRDQMLSLDEFCAFLVQQLDVDPARVNPSARLVEDLGLDSVPLLEMYYAIADASGASAGGSAEVLLNHEFPAFVELFQYWTAEYPPHYEAEVVRIVELVYGTELAAKVAHAHELKGDKNWNSDQYKQLLSPEALTLAALGLNSCDQVISTMLGGKLGKKASKRPTRPDRRANLRRAAELPGPPRDHEPIVPDDPTVVQRSWQRGGSILGASDSRRS